MTMYRVYTAYDIEADSEEEAAIEFDRLMYDPTRFAPCVTVQQWPVFEGEEVEPEEVEFPGKEVDCHYLDYEIEGYA